MRLLMAIVLLMSFSAYGQRVRENIKQQSGVKASAAEQVKTKAPAKKVRSTRR